MSTDASSTSSESSEHDELIQQTKQQIRGLVSEIARLTKADVAPLEFYSEFLTRVVQALAAPGGAVWTPSESGGLELQYQINLQQTGLLENQSDMQRHGRMLHQVLQKGEGALIPPQSGAGDEEEGGNPTQHLLVLAPLKADQETRGVVEVFQRPGTRPNAQRGYLRFLLQMCELAGDYLKTRQLRHFTDRQALWTQLEQFTRAVHVSLDPREAAYTIANEGRRLIECDRVSVALRRGTKCTVEAISGQDTFDKRSNTVDLLNRLATAVVRTGDPMWYTGDTSDMAPQVEEAVEEYVDDSHSKTVAVIPLKEPVVDPDDDTFVPETIGALVVEQIEDARVTDMMRHRVDVVADHSSTALANSHRYNSLFLMPLWRTLGKMSWVVQGRTLPKTIAIAAVVVALIVGMVVVPWDFSLEGDGTLEPVNRQRVFASVGGDVSEIFVKHGQTVAVGDKLLALHNAELDLQITERRGALDQVAEEINALHFALSLPDRDVSRAEKTRLDGQRKSLIKKDETLRSELAILDQEWQELILKSPAAGQIIDPFDLKRELLGRTIDPSHILMELADPTGRWIVEVLMPDDRMGHIGEYLAELRKKDPAARLTASYILATDPGTTHEGTVIEIQHSAEVRGDDGNTVLMRVAVDRAALPAQIRPGAGVKVRVHCGKRSVGYVLLHDVFAFIQSRILFRIF